MNARHRDEIIFLPLPKDPSYVRKAKVNKVQASGLFARYAFRHPHAHTPMDGHEVEVSQAISLAQHLHGITKLMSKSHTLYTLRVNTVAGHHLPV